MNYAEFKLARTQLASLVESQLDVVRGSEYDLKENSSQRPSSLLSETYKRLKEENLRVLVMGKFNAGKSTFLNGLLGNTLLPYKMIPTTAVIGEIKYSETESAILFPKEGKWHGGDTPFQISFSELGKYITIDHSNEEYVESPFQKVVINSPLAICKNGIEFVDSPGLDDPTSHDHVTKEYLPTADAIIYCMTSLAAYSAKDRDEIEGLRSLGYTSIIFVLTYFDKLQENDDLYGTNDAETTKEHIIKTLSPLTDLGENGIFFVNSWAAIKGKMDNDEEMLQKSNFPTVEKSLEQILVNERGRIKLIRSLYQAKNINRNNGKYITESITIASSNHTELAQQLTLAEQNLSLAKEKASLINGQIEAGIKDIANVSKDKGSLYLIDEVLPKIDTWVQEAKPEASIKIDPRYLRQSIKRYTEEVIEHVKSRLGSEINTWSKTQLVPNCIEPRFRNLLTSQQGNLELYKADIDNVKLNLNLPIDGSQLANATTPSAVNRLLSAGGGLLMGDILGAITGGLLGFKGMMTTLAYELTAGIVLGIVNIFNPIGLPAIIIAAVVAAFAGGGHSLLSIKSTIKDKITDSTKEALRNSKDKFSGEIEDKVHCGLSKIKEKIEDELNTPINLMQALVNEARENMNSDGEQLRRKIQSLKSLESTNKEVAEKLDNFASLLG